jgi:putative FmdB family regulatory protein
MPTYEYRCEKCKRKFTIALSIAQHVKKRPTCPRCKSVKVKQQITPFYAGTSSKS